MQNRKSAAHKVSTPIKVALAVGISAIGLLVILAVTLIGNRPPNYSIKDGSFAISTDYGETIRLSDIKQIELKSELPSNLSRTDGYGFGTIIKGKCSSGIGNVTVYLDTSVTPYVYLTTSSGTVILNDQTAEKTRALYKELAAAVPGT